MVIEVVSFDAFNLNDSDFESGLPYESQAFSRQAKAIELSVIGGFARDEGFDYVPARFHLEVLVRTTLTTGMDALKDAFRVGRTGELIVSVDGVERARTCRVEGAYPWADNPTRFIVNLFASDPRWHSPTPATVSESITATGQQWDVVNDGNAAEDRPVLTFTPTDQKAAADSWLFSRDVIYANRVKQALVDHPIDLTNYISTGPSGGLDHDALTTTKSRTDAADIRVLVDGVEVPRYLGEHANTDPDSTRLTIWITTDLSAMQEAKLFASITNVSPANGADLEVLSGVVESFPRRGALYNPSSGELITYTGWTVSNANGRAAFTGIKRGQRGTTAASGSASDQLLFVERRIQIIYGYTSATAPEARPDLKPMLNLASATISNLSRQWIDFYDDVYPDRPGQWARALEERDEQSAYLWMPRADSAVAASLGFFYHWQQVPETKDNFNVARRRFPTGTSGASGQIAGTRVVDKTLAMHVFGVTKDGVEVLLDRLGGELTSGAYSSTYTGKLREVGFYVRSQVVLSTPEVNGSPLVSFSGSSITIAAAGASGQATQVMIATHKTPMRLYAVHVCIWEPGPAAEKAVDRYIFGVDEDAQPLATSLFSSAAGGLTTAQITSAAQWIESKFSRPLPWFEGARLGVNLEVPAGAGSSVLWRTQPMDYAGGIVYGGGALVTFPMAAVRVIGDGEIDEDARAEDGDDASMDGVTVLLDSAGVPVVNMRGEQDCYWFNGKLTNNTTGQYLKFNVFVKTDDVLELDVGNRTFRDVTSGEDLLYGVTASDPEGWLSIAQGPNELQWDEAGLEGVDVDVEYRSRWE